MDKLITNIQKFCTIILKHYQDVIPFSLKSQLITFKTYLNTFNFQENYLQCYVERLEKEYFNKKNNNQYTSGISSSNSSSILNKSNSHSHSVSSNSLQKGKMKTQPFNQWKNDNNNSNSSNNKYLSLKDINHNQNYKVNIIKNNNSNIDSNNNRDVQNFSTVHNFQYSIIDLDLQKQNIKPYQNQITQLSKGKSSNISQFSKKSSHNNSINQSITDTLLVANDQNINIGNLHPQGILFKRKSDNDKCYLGASLGNKDKNCKTHKRTGSNRSQDLALANSVGNHNNIKSLKIILKPKTNTNFVNSLTVSNVPCNSSSYNISKKSDACKKQAALMFQQKNQDLINNNNIENDSLNQFNNTLKIGLGLVKRPFSSKQKYKENNSNLMNNINNTNNNNNQNKSINQNKNSKSQKIQTVNLPKPLKSRRNKTKESFQQDLSIQKSKSQRETIFSMKQNIKILIKLYDENYSQINSCYCEDDRQ